MNSANSILIVLFFSVIRMQGQYTESDWAERDEWMKTTTLLKMGDVSFGDVVADIGCHEGYLSTRLSSLVGHNGKVYAIDVREDRLEKLRANAKKRNISNIITILGDYDNPKLPTGSLDAVFIIDTYHEMDSYVKILEHVKNALKPNGKLMVLEKLKDKIKGKTRKEQVAAHSLSVDYVRKELKQAGFSIISEINDHGKWEKEQDKQMWVILAEKNKI